MMTADQVEVADRTALLSELTAVLPSDVVARVAPACTDEQLRASLRGYREGLARREAMGLIDQAFRRP